MGGATGGAAGGLKTGDETGRRKIDGPGEKW